MISGGRRRTKGRKIREGKKIRGLRGATYIGVLLALELSDTLVGSSGITTELG